MIKKNFAKIIPQKKNEEEETNDINDSTKNLNLN